MVISIIMLALFVSAIAVTTANQNNKESAKKSVSEKPTYQTILPNGKSIDSLGGWSRISPPASEPVFAYNDNIGSVAINVSEQPLPKSFEGNIDTQIADLAKQYNATTQITAGTTKVYIGISSKGPQSVIFTKKNLLILIKSQQKIDDKDWSNYIESLN